MLSLLQKYSSSILLALLPLAFFAMPLSSTAQAFIVNLIVVCVVLEVQFKQQALLIFKQPWVIAALALFFIILASCLWSPASWDQKLLVVEKYSKLLYLPFMVIAFNGSKQRFYALHAFLLAMLITCFISFLQGFGILDYFKPNEHGFVFRNHIITSTMMAFAIYLAGYFGLQTKGYKRLGYWSLAACFAYQLLFINSGRTGYVLFLVFMVILFVQRFSWQKAFLSVALLSALFLGCYQLSDIMQERTHQAIADIEHYRHNSKDTPMGQRLLFRDFAQDMFSQSPVWGNGAASFSHAFKHAAPQIHHVRVLFEPHGQYTFLGVEVGLIGLVAYLVLLGLLWVAMCQLNEMKHIGIAVMSAMVLCSFSDSILFYSASGYFFISLIALCCGEGIHALSTKRHSKENQPSEALA